MNKGFSPIELLIMIVVIALMVLMLPSFFNRRQSNGGRCRCNLDQIGKCMQIYKQDYGRYVRLPDANGAAFIARLYKTELMLESRVYICPSTDDDNFKANIGEIQEGDKGNFISYSGRKNFQQRKYPGVFKPFGQTATTPIASDDFQGVANHEDGQFIYFLFLDGHVDHVRIQDANEDNYYEKFSGVAGNYIADPLTN